jgi:hypothetical protein
MAYFVRGSVLTASDAAASDEYGRVALNGAGNILAVGVPLWEGSYTSQGGVYIYDWSGSEWVQRGDVLTASDAAIGGEFGFSVALDSTGTILAVGSARDSDKGCVYIYDWSGSAWVQRGSVLTASDAADFDYFGSGVALSSDGDVLIVGASEWEGAADAQGGVYIYDWSGSAWVQRGSVLTASDAYAGNLFGGSVACNEDASVLIVGSPRGRYSGVRYGGVYIYDWSGSAWVQRGSVLISGTPGSFNDFGSGVALSDDGLILAVGHRGFDTPTANMGRVELFAWSGSAWELTESLTAEDAGSGDLFGAAVAISADGGLLAIQAQAWDDTATDQGGIYIFAVSEDIGCRISADSPLGSISFLAFLASRKPKFYVLSAYLSGGEDSTTDFSIPLQSFGLNKRSGQPSYYSISAPFSQALLDAFDARPNGMIHIHRDGAPWESFNISHPIRYDIGPRSSSISLSGTRQVTLSASSAMTIEPRYTLSESINSSGELTLDLVPGVFDPRPGDVITWAGDGYTVTLKKFQASAGGQTLSINAEPV